MFLSKIASRKINEPMEAWDELTEQFVPNAFLGRILLTDRFLSNFNKPLRRRMMFMLPEVALPESMTFRHPGTHDVYIAGQRRGDALKGNTYLDLVMCHLVTDTPNGSSGLATIYRKATQGPPDNPGWMVEQVLTKAFVDMEFRTSANEADMYDTKIENYYAYLPITKQLEAWDFIELHGQRYRVVDTFADSGMSGLRIDKEVDTRVDFLLHTEGARVYDKATHQYVITPGTFEVTGVIIKDHEFSTWMNETETYIDVSVEVGHIGFRPEPNTTRLEYQGKSRAVTQVSTQPGERQYRLRCR